MAWKDKCIQWLENNRAFVILIFCLPASLVFDFGIQLKNWFYRTIISSPGKHNERVRNIQKKVSYFDSS